ncbi:MAG TPA: branched-chain amino acid ABC transporter permease [Methylomirabilota bacterium]|nr:branched-chain amino acid ABC transporter permease [Methylomirabilota bacterium]
MRRPEPVQYHRRVLLQQAVNAVTLGSLYALIAIGLAITFSILDVVNFAQGSLVMWGAYLGAAFAVGLGLGLWVPLLAAMLLVGLLGVALERGSLQPLRRRRAPPIAALLATLGSATILDHLILIVFGPDTRPFPSPFPVRMVEVAGAQVSTLEVTITAIALALLAGLQAMLRRTRLGLAMRAIAQDGRVAGLMGIDTDRVVALAFGIGAAVGGVGGVLTGIYYNSVDVGMGYSAGLKGFTAMVIGGMGSLPGAILGGYLLGAAETAATAVFWSGYRDIIAFGLLIVVLIVRPAGLLGTPEIRKV